MHKRVMMTSARWGYKKKPGDYDCATKFFISSKFFSCKKNDRYINREYIIHIYMHTYNTHMLAHIQSLLQKIIIEPNTWFRDKTLIIF